MKENEEFKFLPTECKHDFIVIYPPFSLLAYEYFIERRVNILKVESDKIKISFKNMNENERNSLLKEIKIFIKNYRQKIIDDFLIYNGKIHSYL